MSLPRCHEAMPGGRWLWYPKTHYGALYLDWPPPDEDEYEAPTQIELQQLVESFARGEGVDPCFCTRTEIEFWPEVRRRHPPPDPETRLDPDDDWWCPDTEPWRGRVDVEEREDCERSCRLRDQAFFGAHGNAPPPDKVRYHYLIRELTVYGDIMTPVERTRLRNELRDLRESMSCQDS